MAGRLDGKRGTLTDPGYYSGPGIIKVFEAEGAELFADDRDLTMPGAAEDLVARVAPAAGWPKSPRDAWPQWRNSP